MSQSHKQGSENGNDVINQIGHLMERFNNRLTLNNPSLGERYDKVELHILLHFRFRDSEEYIACFQRDMPDIHESPMKVRNGIIGPTSPETFNHLCPYTWQDAVRRQRRNGGNQQAVFVEVVKRMEPPENFIPTFVWFDRMDSVYGILPHSLYFSNHAGFVFRGVIKNREINMPSVPAASPTGTNLEKLEGHMVKGASEVLQNITDDCADGRKNVFNADEVIGVLSRLWVALGFDYIWIGGKEGFTRDIQIIDVLFGPFDFYADNCDSFIGSHQSPP